MTNTVSSVELNLLICKLTYSIRHMHHVLAVPNACTNTSEPCHGHGTCYNINYGASTGCTCDKNFSGHYCETGNCLIRAVYRQIVNCYNNKLNGQLFVIVCVLYCILQL